MQIGLPVRRAYGRDDEWVQMGKVYEVTGFNPVANTITLKHSGDRTYSAYYFEPAAPGFKPQEQTHPRLDATTIFTGTEFDPKVQDQHAPGAKLDGGKQRPMLILRDMARAVWGVIQVATFGATKYSDGGWLEVEDGVRRYEDAMMRHILKKQLGEVIDADSKLPHDDHIAWNALAISELNKRKAK